MVSRLAKLTCPDCGFVCGPSQMSQHRIKHDPNAEVHTCPHCPRTFLYKGGLVMHIKLHQPFDVRFFAKVRMTSECWLWTGSVDSNGYPHFTVGFDDLYAHRIMYENVVGPIPAGMTIDHTCHNADESCNAGNDCLHRRCVNPAHLEACEAVENWRRGRGPAVLTSESQKQRYRNRQKALCHSNTATPEER